jgi:hypothetical protein
MSVNKRDAFAAKGILSLVLLLFSLNTISHDYLCHEELQGVCNPLHWSATSAAPELSSGISIAPRPIESLSLPGDQNVIPGFISDIYHPPD